MRKRMRSKEPTKPAGSYSQAVENAAIFTRSVRRPAPKTPAPPKKARLVKKPS
jgi:hypothetical protein